MSSPETLELLPPTDQSLNQTAAPIPVAEIGSEYVQAVIDRMLALAAAKGKSKHDTRQMVGLAAVQLGVPLRIVTIDLTADGSLKPQHLQVIINPNITKRSSEQVLGREGCWSCGRIHGAVERSVAVTLDGFDRQGQPLHLELVDFVARIAQHELDHLDGIRFPDRIPADKPERLHFVEPSEFPAYRLQWMEWPRRCPRDAWLTLKNAPGHD